jgi:hypothetical protein
MPRVARRRREPAKIATTAQAQTLARLSGRGAGSENFAAASVAAAGRSGFATDAQPDFLRAIVFFCGHSPGRIRLPPIVVRL